MASQGTRKAKVDQALNKKRKGRYVKLMAWARRFGLILAVVTGLVWLGSWFVLSGGANKTGKWIHGQVLQATADAGFTLENINLEGRVHADADVIMALLNMQRGDPLFAFEPEGAQELLQQITWVKTVKVERRLPDTIYIRLVERQPLAVWQKPDGKSVLIDVTGAAITDYNLERFNHLPVIKGDEAYSEAPSILAMVAVESLVAERLKQAEWIGARRWDLMFESGVIVKLPEEDIGFALRRLARAQEEDALLDKTLAAIDLREEDRIVIRTKPGEVKKYNTGLKL